MPRGRSRIPTLQDVARASGLSLATVDRVLNRRGGVREITARRVLEAAAACGYLPDDRIRQLLQPPPLRPVFLVPAGTNPYLRLLARRLRDNTELAARFGARPVACFVDSFDPKALAESLARHGRRADGIAFMALAHPLVREAVDRLVADGRPVVTFISDLPDSARTAYVGLDNRAVGRTAAWFVGRFLAGRRGKVALIAGSLRYRAHEDREMGFLSLLAEHFPELEPVAVREGHDDVSENYQHARALLARHPDLVAIYNVGGSSGGIARALVEAGRARDVVFVGHGLTPDTRTMLLDGTMDLVFTQNPDLLLHNCLQIFANLRAGRPPAAGVTPLHLEIVSCENLP